MDERCLAPGAPTEHVLIVAYDTSPLGRNGEGLRLGHGQMVRSRVKPSKVGVPPYQSCVLSLNLRKDSVESRQAWASSDSLV